MNTRPGIVSSFTLALVAAAAGFAFAQAPRNGEFLVNTSTVGFQDQPSVAMVAEGRFVVAWVTKPGGYPTTDVKAQRFDVLGRPLGIEFTVSSNDSGPCASALLAGTW